MKSFACQKYEHRNCVSEGTGCRCFCHLFDRDVYSCFEMLARLAAGLWARVLDAVTPRRRYRELLAMVVAGHKKEMAGAQEYHERAIKWEREIVAEAMKAFMRMRVTYEPAVGPRYDGRYRIETFLSNDLVDSYGAMRMPREEVMRMLINVMTDEFRRQLVAVDFMKVRTMTHYDEMARSMGEESSLTHWHASQKDFGK